MRYIMYHFYTPQNEKNRVLTKIVVADIRRSPVLCTITAGKTFYVPYQVIRQLFLPMIEASAYVRFFVLPVTVRMRSHTECLVSYMLQILQSVIYGLYSVLPWRRQVTQATQVTNEYNRTTSIAESRWYFAGTELTKLRESKIRCFISHRIGIKSNRCDMHC